jgi:DNA/RNA endonuclease YhcR with UshA esterase domain
MRDITLLRIALVCGLIGTGSLLVVSRNVHIDTRPIEPLVMDEEVAIKGEVISVLNRGGVTLIDVGYRTHIRVVLFNSAEVSKGDRITVVGRLEEYKGQKELIGDKLILR